ncbi:PhzF family phenazine biosynthesis protein [Cognatiyoonia sp. IB215182]|uniref:PhzF family phenazine biosynthesis protein n=1 Tax=Cognatiyoonia sp. IB215182 TaxID=3097353 RepID=UPI002A141EE1|nr:PhzF family phenazine biosynthesis protein [Cognatiyoonia sp. IB215182]MDX8351516.1 PhzF family phenazine biosynthesis protein [Cognatiyoonia sp. IB215182]
MRRRFLQCDVFSAVPTKGNGLAVVVDADGLTTAQMQDFAAWTNLAETTFLLPPTRAGADYAVRIFTPGREMPFAGHPTLGSCAAWLHCGGQPQEPGLVRQECQIGLVEIDTSGDVPAFVAPPTDVAPLAPAAQSRLMTVLGLDASQVIRTAHLNNGPVWQVLELKDAATVLAIDADRVRWPEYVGVGVVGAHAAGNDIDYEVRNLAPSSGMSEDPITGSLNAAIAHWMFAEGRLDRALVMAQGTVLGREGRVFVASAGSDVTIGGHVHVLIDGTVDL